MLGAIDWGRATLSSGATTINSVLPSAVVEEDDHGEKMMATADNVTSSMSKAKDTHHHRSFFTRTTYPTCVRRQCSNIIVISKKNLIYYTIIFIIFVMATVDQLSTFIINERALLTKIGRQNYRTRQRVKRKSRFCDETDEPKPWQIFTSGWRSLSTCEEFDLSLRRHKLGDNGVKRLMNQLGRKEYANGKRRGKLRVLNLERQGITRRGAGYISRWLSADPLEANEDTAHVVDVDRIPTAASTSIFINLEGNPIGLLGFKDLQRAVEKARINGIKVVIVGGGSVNDSSRRGNSLDTRHVVKVGPVTYSNTCVAMKPWRLPVPFIEKISGKDRLFVRVLKAVVIFIVGLTLGRATAAMRLPYRLAFVRNTEWSTHWYMLFSKA